MPPTDDPYNIPLMGLEFLPGSDYITILKKRIPGASNNQVLPLTSYSTKFRHYDVFSIVSTRLKAHIQALFSSVFPATNY